MKNWLLLISLLSTTCLTSFEVSAQTLSSSDLPIVIINTNGATIADEPKVQVEMGIIYNGQGVVNNVTDPWNEYNGHCGIEWRGNSTQGFDKKNYSIELWDSNGQDTSHSLLGMPSEEDWVLHAMHIDKTLLRIPMSFYLGTRMGRYNSRWRYVEVVLDGDYRGVYALVEKIKRDKNRVDIAKLKPTDLAGDSLTGGYILRLDWLDDPEGFESNYNALSGDPMFFQWYYPKANNIQPQQAAYIEGYMAEFEEALFSGTNLNGQGKHWLDYADITSFTDFLISNELSKNSDGYKLSSYLYKDKESNGGKFVMGPLWDFDQTYGVSDVCSNDDPTGWTYLQNQPGCEDLESMPAWWNTWMNNPIFTNHLACRWNTLRQGPLHQDTLFNWIDSHRAEIQTAADRNFVRWPIIGISIWAEPQPIPQSYEEEITALKSWMTQRLTWLDNNIPGNCANDIIGIPELSGLHFNLFPNPSTGVVQVQVPEDGVFQLNVMTIDGKTVHTARTETRISSLQLDDLAKGIYLLEVSSESTGQRGVQRLVIH